MSWRKAAPSDDDLIVEMSATLYREDPGPRPVPPEQMRATLAELRRSPVRGEAWVLDLGGAKGYALLITFWSNEVGGEILTVDEIFVNKELRGSGHGRAFFQKLLTEKRSRALDLEVTPSNTRARKFYESLGFQPLKNAHLRVRY